MSLLFGGGGSKPKPQFTGLAVQTSTSAIGIPIGFGKNRSSHNVIWQNDFKANKKKQKAGKGLSPSTTTYTYSGSFMMALGWGPINDVTRVWKDQSKVTNYAELGFSLFVGETPQSPWGYLESKHPSQSLGYPGIAYFAVANYDLGQGNSLPQHSFEIEWPLFDTQVGGNGDADPALVMEAFLTNESYGVGFDFSVFDQETVFSGPDAPTTGDSSYQTYCQANGFGISPVISNQQAAKEIIERWTRVTNTAIVWNGYQLKLRPYGSEVVEGNGVRYNPDFPVRYTLSDKDFLRADDQDPIVFDRVDPADAKNGFSIVISNRQNEYNELPVSWKDQGLIDQYGYRKADQMEAKEICEPEMASKIVALIGQRIAYVRNKFMFSLGPKYSLLEPMDIVVCVDPVLGTFPVLIEEFEETEDGTFRVTAEEYNGATGSLSAVSTQTVSNNAVDTAVSPGPVNPPVILEAPRSLTQSQGTTPEIWIAVSGGNGTIANQNWGGCYVWASTDDVKYNQIGAVDVPSRMGKLTGTLANFFTDNPDTINTLRVTLDMSEGELEDATADDAAAFLTLALVGDELISYQNVDATGEFDYDITTLYRGIYGTARAAHFAGARFARLDDDIFKYAVPPQYVGKTIYLKFQSYNQFRGGVEDLSTCVAYPFTVSGSAFGTGTGGVPATPSGFGSASGAGFVRLAWNPAAANDGVTTYQVFRAIGSGQPFGSAIQIDTVPGNSRSYTDNTGTPDQPYTYFIKAVNSVGASAASSGANGTPQSISGTVDIWTVSATGTGASQDITLPVSVSNSVRHRVFVFVNGLRAAIGEYSISGTTLTITTNASGDAIQIVGITS